MEPLLVLCESPCKWHVSKGSTSHNIMKQCALIHVGFLNLTIRCPNLVQGDSNKV